MLQPKHARTPIVLERVPVGVQERLDVLTHALDHGLDVALPQAHGRLAETCQKRLLRLLPLGRSGVHFLGDLNPDGIIKCHE